MNILMGIILDFFHLNIRYNFFILTVRQREPFFVCRPYRGKKKFKTNDLIKCIFNIILNDFYYLSFASWIIERLPLSAIWCDVEKTALSAYR